MASVEGIGVKDHCCLYYDWTVIKISLRDCMADKLKDINGLFGRYIFINC